MLAQLCRVLRCFSHVNHGQKRTLLIQFVLLRPHRRHHINVDTGRRVVRQADTFSLDFEIRLLLNGPNGRLAGHIVKCLRLVVSGSGKLIGSL